MAKKDFKLGLDHLFQENMDEIKSHITEKEQVQQVINTINLDEITDEKVKWLFIKLQRIEKELKLWRTGEINLTLFNETIKKNGLKYNPEINNFEAI